MVISTCRQCNSRHLIADNQNQLDLKNESGYLRVDQLLTERGEAIKRVSTDPKFLSNHYVVECDGNITFISKNDYLNGSYIHNDNATIVEVPIEKMF